MKHPHFLLLLLLLVCSALVACGGSKTPADQDKLAGQAMVDEDYAKALELFQELLNWQGEQTVDAKLRFKASLESVKCLALLERFDEMMESFKALETDFPEEMAKPDAYKHSLAVSNLLFKKNAEVAIIGGLLKYSGEKYPDMKAKFDAHVEDLKKRATSDKDKEALKALGYL